MTDNLFFGPAESFYHKWPDPICIVSDGPYGVGGYDGDLSDVNDLGNWYEKHIEVWSDRCSSQTTLWFWNTEIGWAEVHPFLKKYGWKYKSCNVWNKGIGYLAGNVNTKTIRNFPIVTELCVQYVREDEYVENTTKNWLREEWIRTGLPLNEANVACGVRNAATRKYLTKDNKWYLPTDGMLEKLKSYANLYGNSNGKPYFETDLEMQRETKRRAKFHCPFGVTNVWDIPSIRGGERIKEGSKSFHPNQKPLKVMERIIESSSDVNDVVWEPFGGLCSAYVAAKTLGRIPYAAEIVEKTYERARKRIINVDD